MFSLSEDPVIIVGVYVFLCMYVSATKRMFETFYQYPTPSLRTRVVAPNSLRSTNEGTSILATYIDKCTYEMRTPLEIETLI